jgi:hypothetical protein
MTECKKQKRHKKKVRVESNFTEEKDTEACPYVKQRKAESLGKTKTNEKYAGECLKCYQRNFLYATTEFPMHEFSTHKTFFPMIQPRNARQYRYGLVCKTAIVSRAFGSKLTNN